MQSLRSGVGLRGAAGRRAGRRRAVAGVRGTASSGVAPRQADPRHAPGTLCRPGRPETHQTRWAAGQHGGRLPRAGPAPEPPPPPTQIRDPDSIAAAVRRRRDGGREGKRGRVWAPGFGRSASVPPAPRRRGTCAQERRAGQAMSSDGPYTAAAAAAAAAAIRADENEPHARRRSRVRTPSPLAARPFGAARGLRAGPPNQRPAAPRAGARAKTAPRGIPKGGGHRPARPALTVGAPRDSRQHFPRGLEARSRVYNALPATRHVRPLPPDSAGGVQRRASLASRQGSGVGRVLGPSPGQAAGAGLPNVRLRAGRAGPKKVDSESIARRRA